MKKSLKTKIATYLVIMAIIPIIAMGAIISYFQKDAFTSEIHDKTSTVVNNLNDNIELFVSQNKNLVSFLATTRAVRSMDQNEFTPFLYDMVQQNPQVLRINIADLAGNITAVPFAAFPEDFDVTQESWYTGSLDKKGMYITKIKTDSMSGNFIISISNTILSNTGEPMGVISADISLVSLTNIAMNIKLGENGYAYITDTEGNVIAHKDYKVVKQKQNYSNRDYVKKALGGESGFTTYSDENKIKRFVAYAPQKSMGWGVFVQQPVSEAFYHVNNTTKIIVISAIIIAIMCIGMGIWIGNSIAKPIAKLAKVTEKVAKGDLKASIDIKDSTEIGILASSFKKMINSLKMLVTEVFTVTENLSASAEELASGAEQTNISAQEVSRAIEQIAIGAGEQTGKIQNISSVIDELVLSNGNVKSSANSTAQAAEEMFQNSRTAQKGIESATEKMTKIKSSVNSTYNVMQELDTKVVKIGEISSIIQEIVDQTNLLALNASIEAARAGEYGRGFAVVADEVRKLAEQSGEAAQQIADIVNQIQTSSNTAVTAMAGSNQQVDEGQELVLAIQENINNLINSIELVTDRSHEISGELTAQYNHVQTIVEMIQEISSISQETAAGTQEVSASSEEQTATMESIAASAQELAKLAEDLSSHVNNFKI